MSDIVVLQANKTAEKNEYKTTTLHYRELLIMGNCFLYQFVIVFLHTKLIGGIYFCCLNPPGCLGNVKKN